MRSFSENGKSQIIMAEFRLAGTQGQGRENGYLSPRCCIPLPSLEEGSRLPAGCDLVQGFRIETNGAEGEAATEFSQAVASNSFSFVNLNFMR